MMVKPQQESLEDTHPILFSTSLMGIEAMVPMAGRNTPCAPLLLSLLVVV